LFLHCPTPPSPFPSAAARIIAQRVTTHRSFPSIFRQRHRHLFPSSQPPFPPLLPCTTTEPRSPFTSQLKNGAKIQHPSNFPPRLCAAASASRPLHRRPPPLPPHSPSLPPPSPAAPC
jgi:hypothetical protein